MSDRQRVREYLATKEMGTHAWWTNSSPRRHACANAPGCGLPKDSQEAAKAVDEAYRQADETYVSVMDRVDWNRTLMLASSRHRMMLAKYPDQHLSDSDMQSVASVTGVCGPCMKEAVMLDAFGQFQWPTHLDTPSRDYNPEGNYR